MEQTGPEGQSIPKDDGKEWNNPPPQRNEVEYLMAKYSVCTIESEGIN